MDIPTGFSLKVRNYKCFGDEPQGFDRILPINVIIGRNNSGKSSLLELVKYAVEPYEEFVALGHKGNTAKTPEVVITQNVAKQELQEVFRPGATGGTIGNDHWRYAQKWVGARITYKLEPGNQHMFLNIDPPFNHGQPDNDQQRLATLIGNPFHKKRFRRLLSERNIVSEPENAQMHVTENGAGATNALQKYFNDAQLPGALVEEDVLTDLNTIFEPDSRFSRILVQRLKNGYWEIYLDEVGKGRIPVSQAGSGLKTVLLVLMCLHLIPDIEKKSLGDYTFAFEELENNLHPALQRRLLAYLKEFVLTHGCLLFLSTHSSVVIDTFSRDKDSQILHVTHNGDCAIATNVQTYVQKKGILDDLDVRASDLLQSNCVVWMEGPSDRLYFNRWVTEWTQGALKEGAHYQCMSYGGRLLAHLSAASPEEVSSAIAILRLNKNAVVLMDSDKTREEDDINGTKKRIKAEIEEMGGLAWITSGREIENYLPANAIRDRFQLEKTKPLGKFQDIGEYLVAVAGHGRGEYERKKVEFAAEMCPLLTKDSLSTVLDLGERLDAVCNKIREWNGRPVDSPVKPTFDAQSA